jgi:hypothetical protein
MVLRGDVKLVLCSQLLCDWRLAGWLTHQHLYRDSGGGVNGGSLSIWEGLHLRRHPSLIKYMYFILVLQMERERERERRRRRRRRRRRERESMEQPDGEV